jgi:hypothetical protein
VTNTLTIIGNLDRIDERNIAGIRPMRWTPKSLGKIRCQLRSGYMPDILHFRRDMTNVDFDQMIGPDFGRRYLGIKHVDYDAETNVSTVTLRGILPAEFRGRIKPRVAEQQARERIRKLFIG